MTQEFTVIGRGTWLDKVADEIIQREKSFGRDLSLLRVESGLGASGLPHIGSVGDAIRSYGVKLALENIGYRSELIAYSDDFDGLRKVPAGFPSWLNDYISQPVTRIPDPFKCHDSYGAHVGSLLRDSLDKLGIEYKFVSGAEAYKKGLLTEQMRKILTNAERIGSKIKEMVGQEKYEQLLPYTPVCSQCGRIYTTRAYSYDAVHDSVHYKCEGTQLGSQFIKGCGNEGDARITDGNGKLAWKAEFAARWAALDIRFEAHGKELTDSVKINDWVSQEILGFAPPYHVKYELFQDKTGKKISKSSGNLVTPEEWLTYASPASLRLLMFKRIIGARNISLDDIPMYMDEFDELEEHYFGEKEGNAMKDARLRGLYEYSSLLHVPDKTGPHVPYRVLADMAAAAPENSVENHVVKRLIASKAIQEPTPELLQRIAWASKWTRRNSPETSVAPKQSEPLAIDDRSRAALIDFADRLKTCKTPDEIQTAAFESMRRQGLETKAFFPIIYRILVGAERGPKLGPYIQEAGTAEVSEKIMDALGHKA